MMETAVKRARVCHVFRTVHPSRWYIGTKMCDCWNWELLLELVFKLGTVLDPSSLYKNFGDAAALLPLRERCSSDPNHTSTKFWFRFLLIREEGVVVCV